MRRMSECRRCSRPSYGPKRGGDAHMNANISSPRKLRFFGGNDASVCSCFLFMCYYVLMTHVILNQPNSCVAASATQVHGRGKENWRCGCAAKKHIWRHRSRCNHLFGQPRLTLTHTRARTLAFTPMYTLILILEVLSPTPGLDDESDIYFEAGSCHYFLDIWIVDNHLCGFI